VEREIPITADFNRYWGAVRGDEEGAAWINRSAAEFKELAAEFEDLIELTGFHALPDRDEPEAEVGLELTKGQGGGLGLEYSYEKGDVLLELCSTVGHGSLGQFATLVRKAEILGVPPSELLLDLAALGHLDLEFDDLATRPELWTIAPSTVYTTERAAYLVGNRSRGLIQAMGDVATLLEGRLVVERAAHGPVTVRVDGLDPEGLEYLCAELTENRGIQIVFADRPDLEIARGLPHISGMVRLLDPVGPLATAIDRFDEVGGQFHSHPGARVAGLYRSSHPYNIYWLYGAGLWSRVSYRVGKHVAAIQGGASLARLEDGSLSVLIGARLPGLYERAATLASGKLPVLDSYRHWYSDVPSAVAQLLIRTVSVEK